MLTRLVLFATETRTFDLGTIRDAAEKIEREALALPLDERATPEKGADHWRRVRDWHREEADAEQATPAS